MRGRTGAWAISLVMTAAAIVLTVWAQHLHYGPQRAWVAGLVIVAAYVARRTEINFEVREHGMATDAGLLVLTAALVVVSPLELVVANTVSSLPSVFTAVRRRDFTKAAFNFALQAFSPAVMAIGYVAIAGTGTSTDTYIAVAIAAALLSSVVELVLIAAVIRITSGADASPRLVVPLTLGLAAALVNSCLGLIAHRLYTDQPALLALLAAPASLSLAGYRRHSRLSAQHIQLDRLYRYTSTLARAPELHEVLVSTMREAVDATNARRCRLVLLDSMGAIATALELVMGEDPRPIDIDPEHAPAAITLVLNTGTTQRDAAGAWAAVPLLVGTSVAGVLLVEERVGSANTFVERDLGLLGALADHAAISVENARLINEIRRESNEREHQALHDTLTGLGNRRMFNRGLSEAISRSRNDGTTICVLLVDLNGFKDVNDLLGHAAGDEALRLVGERLRVTCDDHDCLARLGGDEFAIVAPGDGIERGILLGEAIRLAVEEPLQLDGVALSVGASVGIARFPEHGNDASTLLKGADQALYAAKQHPEQPVQVFDGAEDHSTARRVILATDLREALEHHRLEVYYQPQAELATGRLVGAEALARWNHPSFGFIPPDEFVAIAEHIGLIGKLSRFVLDQAIGQAAAWNQAGHDMAISINLSTRNLLDPSLPTEIHRLLLHHQVHPSRVTLEITETEIMAEPERAIPLLDRLAELGVALAIDDFGTGYSSLSYLKRLRVSELKVDKSFVIDMPTDPSDAAIVRTVIQLAENLGLEVVAEGIEDQVTWDMLKAMGCQRGQGYFLARPLPASQFASWLAQRGPLSVGLTSS